MTRLTSRAATLAGYTLARTDSGRTRVIGPDGTKYAPCDPSRATLVIVPGAAVPAERDAAGNCRTCGEAGRCPGWHGTPGILPLTLKATEMPAALLLALTERRKV
jgi:hypothetical protein